MSKILKLILLVSLIQSCDKIDSSFNKKSKAETIKEGNEFQIDFENPNFKDRTEELIYIREYVLLKVPTIFLTKNPKRVNQRREKYATYGNYYTKEEVSKRLSKDIVTRIMSKVQYDDISFQEIKQALPDLVPKYPETPKIEESKPYVNKSYTVDNLSD